MKYQTQINEAFESLGFTPRPGQVEAVNDILIGFLDIKYQNQILNAPTGTGKSIIGAVSAEALSICKGLNKQSPKASIMLCSTNILSKQYDSTFKELANKGNYIMIKGASNYPCSALSTPELPETAESCAWFTMIQAGSDFESTIKTHCDKCEYLCNNKRKNQVRHLTTNYSYFFVDRMYTGKFEDRSLIVWDEAHLINDLFSEHNAILFSQKKVQAMAKEIGELVGIADMKINKILTSVAKDCGVKDKINDSNYRAYLSAMYEVYSYAAEQGKEQADKALRSNKTSQYTKLTRFYKRYESLACKIDDLTKYEYEHVFEYKEEDCSISIKPIFVGTMIEALQCSDHNLFMSATVSNEFMVKTLNLDPTKTGFLKIKPTFPIENKEVVFFDPLSLNYTTLQNPDTIKALRKNVSKIVKKHVADGERGIILSPSFKLQNEIVAELHGIPGFKLFEQRQGEKLENTLEAFKAYKGGPAILISPSIFEGVDLPGDLSRFQIVIKAPFPSLGDKRMKFILDHHKEIYEIITIQKLVQGAGRSVRSETDHATTYFLDMNAQRLWGSKANIWGNEFRPRYTKFI